LAKKPLIDWLEGRGPAVGDTRGADLGVPAGSGPNQAAWFSLDDYELLKGAIRETVDRVVPVNSTVLVVSRGDEELLRLGPRQAFHFPQDRDGSYAGYHPTDSDAAIAMLEELGNRGAEYIVFPATTFWWLDFYDRFRDHIEKHHEVVASGDDCWIARLVAAPAEPEKDVMKGASTPLAQPIAEIVTHLLPADNRIAVLSLGEDGLAKEIGLESLKLVNHDGDESTAIGSLRTAVSSNTRFVIVPETLFEWMEDHPAVKAFLAENYRLVTRQQHLCEIYELSSKRPAVEGAGEMASIEERAGRSPSLGERLKAAVSRLRQG
jgi:hypothetical protein